MLAGETYRRLEARWRGCYHWPCWKGDAHAQGPQCYNHYGNSSTLQPVGCASTLYIAIALKIRHEELHNSSLPLLFFCLGQLGTGTGIAPFRGFLWRMFFEKHDDYKVLIVFSHSRTFRAAQYWDCYNIVIQGLAVLFLTIWLLCSSTDWHGCFWEFPPVAVCYIVRYFSLWMAILF